MIYTVRIFETGGPGFPYLAQIFLGGVLLIKVGGMTVDEAEEYAREWIRKDSEPPPTPREVRAFTVNAAHEREEASPRIGTEA